jgi:trans-aconitate 2-methyltransferase
MTEQPVGTVAQWDPHQYEQFHDERAQPFHDLAALVQRRPGMRVVDLGCGTGEMTQWLHGELGAAETVGLDSSDQMLALAEPRAGDGLHFEREDVVDFAARGGDGPYDVIFSNAALQWVTAHETLFAQFTDMLAPGGQLAIQVPSGGDHAARDIMPGLAAEEPYVSAMDGYRRAGGTRTADWYATRLHELGYADQNVRMQVYGHVLPEPRSVVEWFKGSGLGPYRDRLSPELYASFVAEYERRVVERCGEGEPYFLPFNRILIWGHRP